MEEERGGREKVGGGGGGGRIHASIVRNSVSPELGEEKKNLPVT